MSAICMNVQEEKINNLLEQFLGQGYVQAFKNYVKWV